MPAERSKYTYNRIRAAKVTDFEKNTANKKPNTWVRTLPLLSGPQQSAAAGNQQPPSQLSRGPANSLQIDRPLEDKPLAHVYTRQNAHQLQRLPGLNGTGSTAKTIQQTLSAEARPFAQPLLKPSHAAGRPNSGGLVHASRHKLVRRSSIMSAIARTVAAVKSPRSLRASKRWSREERPASSKPKLVAPASKQPIGEAQSGILRPSRAAGASRKAFTWQRGQAVSPGAKARTLTKKVRQSWLQPSRSRHHNSKPVARKQAQQKRLLGQAQVGKAKPTKLVRIGGTLYRVSGIGKGRSLKRQETLKVVPKQTLAKAVKYQREGNSLRRLSMGPAETPASKPITNTLQRLRRDTLNRGSFTTPSLAKSRPHNKVVKLGVVSKIRRRTKFVNRLCYQFCRTGKCGARDAQLCPLVHDPEKVAVCTKWLQGRCEDQQCPLQHRRKPQLMPMCEHFAKGTCHKLDCAYLHILLDDKAPTCKEFAKGFCPRGASCLKKHLSRRQLMSLKASKTLSVIRKAEEPQESQPRKRRRWPLPLSELAAAMDGKAPGSQGCTGHGA